MTSNRHPDQKAPPHDGETLSGPTRPCQNSPITSSNVQLARQGYAALARGDLEAIRVLLAPDVKWHGGDPEAEGACRNRDQALAFIQAARQEGGGAGTA